MGVGVGLDGGGGGQDQDVGFGGDFPHVSDDEAVANMGHPPAGGDCRGFGKNAGVLRFAQNDRRFCAVFTGA